MSRITLYEHQRQVLSDTEKNNNESGVGDFIEKYVLTEHTEYRWAEVAEIPTLNFVDSDLLIYPQVVRYLADSIPD